MEQLVHRIVLDYLYGGRVGVSLRSPCGNLAIGVVRVIKLRQCRSTALLIPNRLQAQVIRGAEIGEERLLAVGIKVGADAAAGTKKRITEGAQGVGQIHDATQGVEGQFLRYTVDSAVGDSTQLVIKVGNCIVREWTIDTRKAPCAKAWRACDGIVTVSRHSTSVRHRQHAIEVRIVSEGSTWRAYNRVRIRYLLQVIVHKVVISRGLIFGISD